MVRIGIDARFYGTEHTGLGRYTLNTLLPLTQALASHSLVVYLRDPYYSKLSFGPHVIKKRLNLPHYSLAEQLFLPSIVRADRLDLWFSFHFLVPVFSPVPKVTVIHDLIKTYSQGMDTTTHKPFLYRLKRLGYDFAIRRAATVSRGVIVPTNSVKNDLLREFAPPPEKITVVPEAADPGLSTVKPRPPSPPPPAKYLLYVGNAYPHKNLPLLLEALESADTALNLVLVCSSTPYLSRLLSKLSKPTRQRLTFYRRLTDAELSYLYRHAGALVAPSRMEGFGLPGLEALVLGTPVLAANIPPFREVYGSYAHYFSPDSPDELVTLLKGLDRFPRPSYSSSRSWNDVAIEIGKVVDASCSGL